MARDADLRRPPATGIGEVKELRRFSGCLERVNMMALPRRCDRMTAESAAGWSAWNFARASSCVCQRTTQFQRLLTAASCAAMLERLALLGAGALTSMGEAGARCAKTSGLTAMLLRRRAARAAVAVGWCCDSVDCRLLRLDAATTELPVLLLRDRVGSSAVASPLLLLRDRGRSSVLDLLVLLLRDRKGESPLAAVSSVLASVIPSNPSVVDSYIARACGSPPAACVNQLAASTSNATDFVELYRGKL